MDNEKCVIPHCREPAHITYIGKQLCSNHWLQLSTLDLGSEGEQRLFADLGLRREADGNVVNISDEG